MDSMDSVLELQTLSEDNEDGTQEEVLTSGSTISVLLCEGLPI